jgi:hypothetical protein
VQAGGLAYSCYCNILLVEQVAEWVAVRVSADNNWTPSRIVSEKDGE